MVKLADKQISQRKRSSAQLRERIPSPAETEEDANEGGRGTKSKS